jgi:hypothetical protein
MTLSRTSVDGIDLDDLERQMRDVPTGTDNRLAELARQVARSLGGLRGGREQAASATPQQRVSAGSLDEDKTHAEGASAQGLEVPIDQSLHDDGLARLPNAPEAALSSRALEKRGPLSSRALALVAFLLVVAGGIGLAAVMRAGPMNGAANEAPVIKADIEPMQSHIQTPARPTPGAAASLAQPDQRVDVVATNPTPPPAAVIPVVATMPMAASSVSLSDPSTPTTQSSMIGTPGRASKESVKPTATLVSKGTLETAPLPPTKPRTLASTNPTALVRAEPSDAKVNADGASSFSIQLASSESKSDALTTLARLKKQFPDVLGGGSIHRADGGGTGVHYRIQAGPLSRDAANKACSRLRASGENCVVVRS